MRLTLAAAVLLALPAPPARAQDVLTITALDVGQADAVLLDFGAIRGERCGTEWLFDAGQTSAAAALLPELVDCELDAMILSHPHFDHYGGMAAVLELQRRGRSLVRRLWTSGESRGPPRDAAAPSSWIAFEAAYASAGVQPRALREGRWIRLTAEVRAQVLWTGNPNGGHFPDTDAGADINNDSVVLMVHFGERRVLMTGDIEGEAIRGLLERYCTAEELEAGAVCERLRADVLKVPHHGSENIDVRLFSAVAPEVAILSAGHRLAMHHLPRASTVRTLRELGVVVASTSSAGTEPVVVRVPLEGDLEVEAATEVFAWERRGQGWRGVTIAGR